MTIKRRLFIANIMMIISPIVLIGGLYLVFRTLLVSEQSIRGGGSDGMPIAWVLAFIYLASVVILANLWIAKYITRKITEPLAMLVEGVDEISNGNLGHRIDYHGNDEFDSVCLNFNEMATRLSLMVQQQQLDENSRKELIAGISHDLRTPLTSVKMCIDGLKNGVASTPEMQEKYLNTIERKTADIEYIIKQLFAFSKMDIGEFPLHLEPVIIGDELLRLVDNFYTEYEEQGLVVTLATDVATEVVLIDLIQFKNVIQNILGNCVKYCNRPDATAKINCKRVNDFIKISITDNGAGVPEEMLPRMFDVFYRGDEARNNPQKGSGLGLAIAAKIIERFDGKIKATNAGTGGLEIEILLPIQEV